MKPVSFTHFASIVEIAKTDPSLSPHHGRPACQFPHQLKQVYAIRLFLLILNACKKLINADIVVFDIKFCH